MKFILTAGFGLACIFHQAGAQELGTRIKTFDPARANDRTGLSPAENARATMGDYAQCLVQKSRSRTFAFLSHMPGTKAATDAAQNLVVSECLDDRGLKFPHVILRGGLYRALYRKDFEYRNVTLQSEPLDLSKDEGFSSPGYVALRQFGECVVRADPVDSQNIVITSVGSEAEKTAFKNLTPHYSPCLQQGLEVEFSKSAIAGLIAEILYRLSAPAEPASTGRK